jgi:uncharacterized damage-inducible protein DinB
MHDDLAGLYAYNRWANGRTLKSLTQLSEEDYVREMGGGWPSVRATFVHLAGATQAWSVRFQGHDATVLPTVDELPRLGDASALLATAQDALDAFLATLTDEHVHGPFTWKNLKGIEKTAPFWTVLRHVVNHQTYHRGQIASMVKRLGGAPLATDMVVWGIELHEAAPLS